MKIQFEHHRCSYITAFLTFIKASVRLDPRNILISADQRLLRAANAEGISALNPETLAVADVPLFLAGF